MQNMSLYSLQEFQTTDKYYCTELENANMHNFQRQFSHIQQCTLICKKTMPLLQIIYQYNMASRPTDLSFQHGYYLLRSVIRRRRIYFPHKNQTQRMHATSSYRGNRPAPPAVFLLWYVCWVARCTVTLVDVLDMSLKSWNLAEWFNTLWT